jgi:hypothetical protein
MHLQRVKSLAVPLRRRWRIFQQLLRRLRLRHKNSVLASGGPAGADVWWHPLGDGARCPCAALHAPFNDHTFAFICLSYMIMLRGEDAAPPRTTQYHTDPPVV